MEQDLLPGLSIEASELPLSTLSAGCAGSLLKVGFLSKLLLYIADRFLCLHLKIVGSGIQKVISRRRGLSLLRDIGFVRSYRLLSRFGTGTRTARIVLSRGLLASGIPPGY